MLTAQMPLDERERLRALEQLDVLDSAPEREFDALVAIAALVCGVPISLVSLIDHDRQWFKANVGLPGVTETGSVALLAESRNFPVRALTRSNWTDHSCQCRKLVRERHRIRAVNCELAFADHVNQLDAGEH